MKKNVIVLMLDTLQFNYLGCYGNNWIKTPNMDRLAREGVLFENNYIDNAPTVPCRRSMHTGRYSLHYRGWSPLEPEETTAADLCWGLPIDTALIFDCPMYRIPKFGYTRGFDNVLFLHGQEFDHEFYAEDPLIHLDPFDYIEDNVLQNAKKILSEDPAETGDMIEHKLKELTDYLRHRQYWRTDEDQFVARLMKKVVRYLEEDMDPNKQFFLWVDSFDPHEPWDSPSVYDPDMKCPYDPDYKGKDQILPLPVRVEGIYTEPQMHHIRMLYAENVTMCDKWVGYLMEKVRAMGLEENTLFMLVSDHGQPMGNGEHGHGLMRKARPWPYEELVHAPMIIRGPGLPAGKRISAFTQSCDVAPTITDWLGIGEQPEHTGKSLLPLATGEVDKLRDFAVAGHFENAWAIHTPDWSYIHWKSPDMKAHGENSGRIIGKQMADAIKFMSKDKDGGLLELMTPDKKMLEQAAINDADVWPSIPVGSVEFPKNDELYDRQADPFQLKNIAEKDPKKANELYHILREFMADLRTS